jgi:hypothetical protein
MDHEQHLREWAAEPKPLGKYSAIDWDSIRWALAEIDRLRQLESDLQVGRGTVANLIAEIDRLRKCVAERDAELADMRPME